MTEEVSGLAKLDEQKKKRATSSSVGVYNVNDLGMTSHPFLEQEMLRLRLKGARHSPRNLRLTQHWDRGRKDRAENSTRDAKARMVRTTAGRRGCIAKSLPTLL